MAKLVLEGINKYLGGKLIVNNLDLEVASGELVCLLGPSGCGKTTTLRMIAGFLTPESGRILIDGVSVEGIPPERRPTAMVFQQYALWPHMTVYNNIAFGLQLRKLSKQQIQKKVQDVLGLVQLEEKIKAFPAQLSGGQQQRVALARAIVLEPKVLLLDEPLSNLDTKLRIQVREEIREIQRRVGITTIFVTHDQDEAMSISDRVAVLSSGVLEQYDRPGPLYREPQTLYVADFVGAMNLLHGRTVPGGIQIGETFIPCANLSAQVDSEADIAVRPEDVRLTEGEGPSATVRLRIPRGHYQEILLATPWGELRTFTSNDAEPGEQVRYTFQRALIYQNDRLVHESVPVSETA
jgi:putative spermidine/putrescine transport system ATP-binding protein